MVVGECVLTRELCIVCDTAAIVVFRSYLIVRLCVDTDTVGVALIYETIEDILQFILVIARL